MLRERTTLRGDGKIFLVIVKVQGVVSKLNLGEFNIELEFAIAKNSCLADGCNAEKLLSSGHDLAVRFVLGAMFLLAG